MEDRRLIRRAVDVHESDEFPGCVVFQQEVLHLRIAHVVDNLQQMNAQHELEVIGLAPASAGNEVTRLDRFNQRRLGHKRLKALGHAFCFGFACFQLKSLIVDRG